MKHLIWPCPCACIVPQAFCNVAVGDLLGPHLLDIAWSDTSLVAVQDLQTLDADSPGSWVYIIQMLSTKSIIFVHFHQCPIVEITRHHPCWPIFEYERLLEAAKRRPTLQYISTTEAQYVLTFTLCLLNRTSDRSRAGGLGSLYYPKPRSWDSSGTCFSSIARASAHL